MNYKTDAYLITCLTNMHVGSGEANYGVVDNLVQRDPITNVPIIHSSSLKGALREHFKDVWSDDDGFNKLNYVFGKDPKRNGGETEVGYYKFFDANLIVLPVRSNLKPFFRATSNFVLSEINEKAKALGIELNINPFDAVKGKPKVENGNIGCILEDYETEPGLGVDDRIKNILGSNLAFFHYDDFKELSKRLPVIARNQLESGQSKNLWYEEVVPRESRFLFFVSKPKEGEEVKFDTDFESELNNKTIQIGGNASIGYGYTKIINLSSL